MDFLLKVISAGLPCFTASQYVLNRSVELSRGYPIASKSLPSSYEGLLFIELNLPSHITGWFYTLEP